MLVLTRKAGESVEVNGPALVKVSEARKGVVVMGIEAPASTQIWRSELGCQMPTPVNHEMHARQLLLVLRLITGCTKGQSPVLSEKWVDLQSVPVEWLNRAEETMVAYERALLGD